jgi:hypothetical protein
MGLNELLVIIRLYSYCSPTFMVWLPKLISAIEKALVSEKLLETFAESFISSNLLILLILY